MGYSILIQTVPDTGDLWLFASVIYGGVALATLVPVLIAALRKVRLNSGGAGFDDSPHFSQEAKTALNQHYSRLQGTLGFWKNKVALYRRFHLYSVLWTIPSAVLIPIIVQSVSDGNASKFFLTIVSTQTALLLAFHKGLKIDENYKAFRHGESEFYDLYRKMLDTPSDLGTTEADQVETYFKEVETIRRYIRNAETDNLATLEDARAKFASQRPRQR